MSVFTEAELQYLAGGRQLGRIASVGADGTPHVVPVGWIYNAARDTIDVGGRELGRSKKFRDVARTGRVAIVIDDLESTDPWRPRGIEVRGRAEAITMPTPLIQIYPERIVSWGLGKVAARELWPASSSNHPPHRRFGRRRRLRPTAHLDDECSSDSLLPKRAGPSATTGRKGTSLAPRPRIGFVQEDASQSPPATRPRGPKTHRGVGTSTASGLSPTRAGRGAAALAVRHAEAAVRSRAQPARDVAVGSWKHELCGLPGASGE